MAKSGVKMTVNKAAQVVAGMGMLTKTEVLVGIPEGDAARNDGDPLNNATIGYIMENGAPEVNIPARPFLVPGVKAARDKTIQYFAAAGRAALAGNAAAMNTAFNSAGLNAQSTVKNYMRNNQFPPLADRTIAARRARGVTRTKPLLDTLQLLNSVTYVLRKK